MATDPVTIDADEADYPSSDGKPMAETEIHYTCLVLLAELLRDRYAAREDVYVGSNLFVYYQRRGSRHVVAPDVFVALGVPKSPPRRTFIVPREPKAPDVVFEFTSAGTRVEDTITKFQVYRDDLGAREYFLFDPMAEYLVPTFQGFRLDEDGRYAPIEPTEGRLHSEVLGCDLVRSSGWLRLWEDGRVIPTAAKRLREEARLRQVAERQAAEEQRRTAEQQRLRQDAEERARVAEDEIAALRRQLDALRGGPGLTPPNGG